MALHLSKYYQKASLMAQQVKNSPAIQKHRKLRFNPWVGKIPQKRKWQPTPVFLPEKSHGQKSLVGYSRKSLKELGMTDWLNTQYKYNQKNKTCRDCIDCLFKYLPLWRSGLPAWENGWTVYVLSSYSWTRQCMSVSIQTTKCCRTMYSWVPLTLTRNLARVHTCGPVMITKQLHRLLSDKVGS